MPAHSSNRREFLKRTAAAGGVAGLGSVAGCTGLVGSGTLNVAVYGGVFQDVMDEHLFGPFSEEVDFEVQSEEQPTSEEALTQYESAIDAGEAPVDVAIMATTGLLQGLKSDLWHVWGGDGFENSQYIASDLLHESDGGLAGIGALSWYINMVQNTEVFEDPVDSWTALWDDDYEDQLGLLSYASNSFLLEVTAETHFDGKGILDDRDGVREVLEKLEEVKPQAGFWYENEAEFQDRLREAEFPAGMLYNDITLVMQGDDAPVRSNWMQEGSILDHGSWVTLKTTDLTDEARQFIDYASRPEVQDRIASNLFTSPTVRREHSDLDDETYQRIAGPGPESAITPKYELYVEDEEWINERWNEFIVN